MKMRLGSGDCETRREDSCVNVIEIFPNRLTKPKALDIKPIAGFL
jgi:hypothetical protein